MPTVNERKVHATNKLAKNPAMSESEPNVQDQFGPSHYKEVSFDFTAAKKVLQVTGSGGECVPTEIGMWLHFHCGSAIPSWSRFQVVISTDKKLYTHFSADPLSESMSFTEKPLDETLLTQLQAHTTRINRAAVNGSYNNLSIMDGAGWTLIVFTEQIYIECMNHFPEEPYCKRLVDLLKSLLPNEASLLCDATN